MTALAVVFNERMVSLPSPRRWLFRFSPGGEYALRYDGTTWRSEPGDTDADLTVDTRPDEWAAFLMTEPPDRLPVPDRIRVTGTPVAMREFLACMSA
jgi:hypothetical protein